MQDLVKLLESNPYPGRGIVVGQNVVYYWIMGRSFNSRNRIFVETEDGIRTEAHQPELVEDPSLIIYHPVRTMGDDLVVTNGDQTDTIVEQGDFIKGCMLREFFAYEGADEGVGYFLSTYDGDGNPLPTFTGEPIEVSLPSPDEVWAALNNDNKISLYTNVAGDVKIYNKHLGD